MNTLQRLAVKRYGEGLEDSELSGIIRFVLRADSSAANKKILHKGKDRSATVQYHNELNSCGYILKNLKLFLLNAVYYAPKGRKLKTMAKNFKLEAEDIELYKYARKDKVLVKYVKSIKEEVLLGLTEMNELLETVHNAIYVYTKKFVIRKLRFTTMGTHFTMDDITAELIMLGIQGLMKTYPKVESPLHAVNICKTTIHNYGQNMISSATSMKNNLLHRNADGSFTSRKVSLDAFEATDISYALEVSDINGKTSNRQDAADVSFAYRQLLKKYTGRKKTFVYLLSGNFSRTFSLWAKKSGYFSSDNDVCCDRMFSRGTNEKYVDYISEYLKMSGKETQKMIWELKGHLV